MAEGTSGETVVPTRPATTKPGKGARLAVTRRGKERSSGEIERQRKV